MVVHRTRKQGSVARLAAWPDLCEAEGIVRDRNASVLVHSAIDQAMTLAAIAIERAARAEVEAVADRLRLATQAASIGTWDLDVTSGALTWDERVYEIFGTLP